MPMTRRDFIKLGAMTVALAAVTGPKDVLAFPANSNDRGLSFYNTHTGEKLSTVYRRVNGYQNASLQDINHVLRDHRTGDIHRMEPRLMDLLFDLKRVLGTKQPFHVISGYRSPKTNALLHRASTGVASNSYHMKGMAIDIRLPDVRLRELHSAARSLKRGGVGLYTSSNFVHVDVGPVRHWGA